MNVTHEPIPELNWPTMTMDFPAAKGVKLEGLKPDSQARFRIREGDDGRYVIDAIVPHPRPLSTRGEGRSPKRTGGDAAMIAAIIRWSIHNRLLVTLMTLLLAGWGAWSARHIPLDALPDLSDVQVIVKTGYPGQAPQVVESQVTYPLATALLAVPGAVRCAAIPASAIPSST